MILRLPSNTQPLSYYFNQPRPTNLVWVSGSRDPCHLIANVQDVPFFGVVWRINSFAEGTNFKVRLGGHFHLVAGQQGSDAAGNPCSSEVAGFGITGEQWAPYVHAKKAFGIRILSDNQGQGVLAGLGQKTLGATIYGR